MVNPPIGTLFDLAAFIVRASLRSAYPIIYAPNLANFDRGAAGQRKYFAALE